MLPGLNIHGVPLGQALHQGAGHGGEAGLGERWCPLCTKILGCTSGSWGCPSGSGDAPECKVEGGTDRWTRHEIKETEDHRQRLRALWGERKASGSHLPQSCEPTLWFLLEMLARALGPQ